MLHIRDSLQFKGHIQTESKVIEKDIPCNGSQDKVVAILTSEKNRLEDKNCNKWQRRSLYNFKGVNLAKGCNIC